jgi:hypothetical protein
VVCSSYNQKNTVSTTVIAIIRMKLVALLLAFMATAAVAAPIDHPAGM